MTTKKIHSSQKTGLLVTAFALLAALVGPAGAAFAANVTIDLCATAGSMTMPDATSVTVWGYAPGDCTGSPAPQVPGPTLVVDQGDNVTVVLHNNLGGASAILFGGQSMVPDRTGAAAGGTRTYNFTASQPGTFLYQAGLVNNAEHQVSMGLYGALVVRSSTAGEAYPGVGYEDEAVLVLSEIDPALNNAANPAAFDMRNYAPKYFLINGKAFPQTGEIATSAGNRLLLRYVNAGIQYHSMAVLGARQSRVADDGHKLLDARSMIAETFGPGQTADVVVTVPATTAVGTKWAVYDASLSFHSNKASNTTGAFGGMLTFIAVGAPPPPGSDVTGPVTSGLGLTPNPTDGSVAVTVSATVDDSTTGGSNVTAAEFYVDSTAGTPTAMSGVFGGTSASVSGSISAATMASLGSGNHTVYVRGQDSVGNWGSFNHIVLSKDATGPVVSGITMSPNPGAGGAVALSATADDRTTGGSNIAAAEYAVDSGAAQAMTVATPGSPVSSVSGTIGAGLATGTHTVSVRAQDALGNWGAAVTQTLVVDQTGPQTTSAFAQPNPTNGLIGFNSSNPSVRITAAFNDVSTGNSAIKAGEAFIDAVGANGSGIVFLPSDGSFNSPIEGAYADVPLSTIRTLADGNHNVYVHGKDAAGNWGALISFVLTVDKTAPTLTSISVSPSPTNGAPTVALTLNGAADAGTGVIGGEYWLCPTVCADPGTGGGTQFGGTTPTINVSALATGSYTVSARIKDAAGNWSPVRTTTLTVWADAIFSNGFETGNRPWGWTSASTNSGGRLNVTTGAALSGLQGLRASGNNTNYVQFNFGTAATPTAPTYDARFQFRPNGNTSGGMDILAAATSNTFGTTLFRVRYRLNAGTPQVQIQLGTGTTNTTWTAINGGTATNTIEVVWQAVGWGPNPGTLTLYVNGAQVQQLTTTSTGSVGAVRLGAVTATGNNTALHFDGFVSKRQTSPLVGP